MTKKWTKIEDYLPYEPIPVVSYDDAIDPFADVPANECTYPDCLVVHSGIGYCVRGCPFAKQK